MRLKKLTIENFQSHAHTEIHFEKGLNVIVGESDRGKSAVIRALRWLFYNEPRGTDFIRVGEKNCRVECVLEDGTILTRERTPSKNRYILVPPGCEPMVFEGFGSGVPDEVVAAHGAVQVQLDDDLNVNLNLAEQLESPFLLSAPGSLKAKAIGRIHNVHIIDAAVRDTGHDISVLQKEDKSLEKEIEELDGRLKEFEDLPGIRERLQKGERIMKRLEGRQEQKERLIQLQDMLNYIRKEKDCQEEKLMRTAYLETVTQKLKKLEEKGDCLQRIIELHKAYSENLSNRKRVKKILNACRRLEEGEKFLSDLHGKVERWHGLKVLFEGLRQNNKEQERYEKIMKSTAGLSRAGREMEELRGTLDKLKNLQKLFEKLIVVQQAREQNNIIMRRTKDLFKGAACLKRFEEYSERKRVLANFVDKLEDTRQRINRGRKYLAEREKEQKEGLKRYEKLLRELGRCPVCFGKVDSSVIDRIISNLGGD